MLYRIDPKASEFERSILSAWEYLWKTYKDNGGVPRDVSDAITLLIDGLCNVRGVA